MIEQYWKYFIAPLVILFLTLTKHLWFEKKGNSSSNQQKREKYVQEDSESNSDEGIDEDISPALPEDLDHIPLKFEVLSDDNMLRNSNNFYEIMKKRRSIRNFSSTPFPKEIIYNIIKTAGTAPSGAHTEPWTFAVIGSISVKQKIREIIESEEETNYRKRMGKTWTTDLKPLRTNWIKEYLTTAPYLILVFKQTFGVKPDGTKKLHYYNEQSTSIAMGFLLAAIHNAGLYSLTSTPLNCGPSIRLLLNRPSSEKLVFLLPVGFPADDCLVPDLTRKPLSEIMIDY